MATALDMALAHIESLTRTRARRKPVRVETQTVKTAKPRKTATSSRRASVTQPRRKTATKR